MLRWLTAGESHGPALAATIEGLPAGIRVTSDDIAGALARRRLGYGRGARQKFEQDELEILGGVRLGRTLGSPVALRIGRGTVRKERQNLTWAVGYNAIALPIAAGVFEPAFGLVLRPEIAALSMSGSSVLVAVNALLLKRLKLPHPAASATSSTPAPAQPKIHA